MKSPPLYSKHWTFLGNYGISSNPWQYESEDTACPASDSFFNIFNTWPEYTTFYPQSLLRFIMSLIIKELHLTSRSFSDFTFFLHQWHWLYNFTLNKKITFFSNYNIQHVGILNMLCFWNKTIPNYLEAYTKQ